MLGLISELLKLLKSQGHASVSPTMGWLARVCRHLCGGIFLCLGILMRTEVYSGIGQVIGQYMEVAVFRGFSEGRSMVCMCAQCLGRHVD